jgi:DNA invertase Pin-like site-specific DNA recombinase
VATELLHLAVEPLGHFHSIGNQVIPQASSARISFPSVLTVSAQLCAKAYPYVRFSSKRQGLGDSLRRQLDRAKKYATEYGLDIQDKSYEDLGVSAFDGSNVTRGALAAFIEAVETNRIERGSYLLVENLDRISRDEVATAIALLERLLKLDIRLVTLTDGRVYDRESLKDPLALLLVVLTFMRAHEESLIKSDRVKAANKRKRESGSGFVFSQGPGWLRPNADKTGWEIIPEKAESVRKVYECAAKGLGSKAIATLANKESWPVPGRAATWHKTLPHKLLENRRVLGELEPSVKMGGRRQSLGERLETYYPQILSEDVFHAAQASRAYRDELPQRRDDGYYNIFQGILRCGHCGATLARKAKSSKRNSAGYAIYVCADRDRGLTKCPNWNAKELVSVLVPPVMSCVAAEILEGNVKKNALDELAQVRAALAEDQKALERLVGIIEQTGGSPTIAGRINKLESAVSNGTARAEKLQAIVSEPRSEVFEEDLDEAISNAIQAVQHESIDRMAERAKLHQSLVSVVERIRVWPRSHAVLELRGGSESIFLPLSEEAAARALLDSLNPCVTSLTTSDAPVALSLDIDGHHEDIPVELFAGELDD